MRYAVHWPVLPLLAALWIAPAAQGEALPTSISVPTRLPATDSESPTYRVAGLRERFVTQPAVEPLPALAEDVSAVEQADFVDLWPGCDQCPRYGLSAFVGYDAWRGPVDDSWQNNGIHTGLNFGTRLGTFSEWTGVGAQIGGSVGVYDWAGTEYRIARQDEAETQGFLTYGFFRKPNEDSQWSAAVVHDVMLNYNYGALSQSPTITQWRGQIGYATSACNEFGFWGTLAGPTVTRDVPGFGTRTYKSVNQLNFYNHRKWSPGGPDTWLWFGVPEASRLSGDHTLGDYLVGALANCPLNNRISLYALVTYMHPSAKAGPAGSLDEMWNFSIGLSFFPRPNARSNSVAGQCWMPQLPVANNGYFLVDTNATY